MPESPKPTPPGDVLPASAPTPPPTDAAKAELLDLLMDATNDGIVDWNLVAGTTTYNARWKHLLGYEGNELVETPNLWRDLTHPEDLPKVEEQLRDHLELQWPFGHISRMRNRHGGWRWILCRGFAGRNADGDPVRMVITFADVTDRVRAQEQQRALISAIPDTMFRVSGDGRILDVKLGGQQRPSLWSGLSVGRSIAEVVPDRSVIETLCQAVRSATSSSRLQTFEVNRALSNGGSEFQEVRVIASSDGEAVCIVRDISEQRAMERKLFQSQKAQAIGHLAAGIAHEINTPLQYVGDNLNFAKSAIVDLVEVLEFYQGLVRDGTSGGEAAACDAAVAKEVENDLPYVLEQLPLGIGRALQGVERVSRIVRAMRAFSHPGEGHTKEMVNLNNLIENTVVVATNEWRYVANVTTDLDPELPPVPCIAGSLGQVLLNLVVNAAQAIGEVIPRGEKGHITVVTEHHDGAVEIRVQDTGGGIPDGIRSKVFDPFFTTKPVGTGIGQGLAMAHATVAEHKGTIHFETETGKGTTFVIRLPLADSDVSASR
jgi:PAS domain S-box-containing protein